MQKIYDTLVIGAGPSGLSAAIYLKRKGLDIAVLGRKIGGQIIDTSSVENYLGISYATGFELAEKFKSHVDELGVDFIEEEVTGITKIQNEESGIYFSLKLDIQSTDHESNTLLAKTVLISTGAKPRLLGAKGEDTFANRGVTYCATCDGPFFEGLDVAVVGGGNSAVEAALDLSKIAKKVHLLVRSVLRADQILVDKLNKQDNIEVHLGTRVTEIAGSNLVEKVHCYTQSEDKAFTLSINGVFIEIGHVPVVDFARGLVTLNSHDEIIIDSNNMTSVEGIFASGDCTTEKYKQIIIAAGEGARAALSISDYLNRR